MGPVVVVFVVFTLFAVGLAALVLEVFEKIGHLLGT